MAQLSISGEAQFWRPTPFRIINVAFGNPSIINMILEGLSVVQSHGLARTVPSSSSALKDGGNRHLRALSLALLVPTCGREPMVASISEPILPTSWVPNIILMVPRLRAESLIRLVVQRLTQTERVRLAIGSLITGSWM